jgi:hypothetical protein
MNDAPGTDRSITVSGGSLSNSIITSGDGNTVIAYQMMAAAASAPLDGKNPYVGPLAYTVDDRRRFFGREALVDHVWTRSLTAEEMRIYGLRAGATRCSPPWWRRMMGAGAG